MFFVFVGFGLGVKDIFVLRSLDRIMFYFLEGVVVVGRLGLIKVEGREDFLYRFSFKFRVRKFKFEFWVLFIGFVKWVSLVFFMVNWE